MHSAADFDYEPLSSFMDVYDGPVLKEPNVDIDKRKKIMFLNELTRSGKFKEWAKRMKCKMFHAVQVVDDTGQATCLFCGMDK